MWLVQAVQKIPKITNCYVISNNYDQNVVINTVCHDFFHPSRRGWGWHHHPSRRGIHLKYICIINLLLSSLKKVGRARLTESDIHPISPSTACNPHRHIWSRKSNMKRVHRDIPNLIKHTQDWHGSMMSNVTLKHTAS